jgi:hypothetical protein
MHFYRERVRVCVRLRVCVWKRGTEHLQFHAIQLWIQVYQATIMLQEEQKPYKPFSCKTDSSNVKIAMKVKFRRKLTEAAVDYFNLQSQHLPM